MLRCLCFSLQVVFCALVAQLAAVAAPAPPMSLRSVDKSFCTVYVHGAAVREDGTPVPDADVLAWSGSGTGRACTDEQGTFRVGPFFPGDRISIHVAAAGLMSAQVTPEPLPSRDLRDLRIALKPGARLEGRVIAPRNAPLANLQAHLTQENGGGTVYFSAVDTDGTFQLTDLPEGRYTLTIERYSSHHLAGSESVVKKQRKQTLFMTSIYLSPNMEPMKIEARLPARAFRPISGDSESGATL